jgi:hypothetical protein
MFTLLTRHNRVYPVQTEPLKFNQNESFCIPYFNYFIAGSET